MSGLSDTGFLIKRLPEIKADLEAAFKAAFPDITVEADSGFGQVIGVVSKPIADIWEILELVYLSQYPASAEGFSLDGVAQYIALTRLAATRTQAVALLIGATSGTPVPIGTQFSVTETGEVFETLTAATIIKTTLHRCKVEITDAVDTQFYGVEIDTVSSIYQATVPSDTVESIAIDLKDKINADSGDKVTASIDPLNSAVIIIQSDNTDVATEGTFDADIDVAWTKNSFTEFGSPVAAEAQNTGPVLCLAGTLVNIDTPVSGLDEVTNIDDGVIGRNTETDTEFRVRRALSLSATGAGTLDSIRSRILQEVESVTACSVFENRTDVIDGGLRPPHSFQAVVNGGAPQAIGEKIWQLKPAGIETYGGEPADPSRVDVDVEDSNGDNQVMHFSRPISKYGWIRVVLTLNLEEEFPQGGIAAIENSLLAYGETFILGQDMIYQKFFNSIYIVQGIAHAELDIALTANPLDTPSYVQTNVAVGDTHIAIYDMARIAVSFAP